MGSFHILGFVISIVVYLLIVSLMDFDFHYLAMIKPLHLLNLGIYILASLGVWLLSKVISTKHVLFASIPSFVVFAFWSVGVMVYGDPSPQKLNDFILMVLSFGITSILLLIIVIIN